MAASLLLTAEDMWGCFTLLSLFFVRTKKKKGQMVLNVLVCSCASFVPSQDTAVSASSPILP